MASFNSIQSIQHIDEATGIVELQCSLNDEYRLSELPLDRDQICASFIEFVDQADVGWEDPQYYRDEPETCYRAASQALRELIIKKLEHYNKTLGEHYPFEMDEIDIGVIRKKKEISAVGLAYVWLKTYKIVALGTDYMQFEDNSGAGGVDEKTTFFKAFERVFEYVGTFAMAGRLGLGIGNATPGVWMTAASRSARDYLALLNQICADVGHGRCKSLGDLPANLRTTNDGRVDTILITKTGENFSPASELYLTQITIQKSNLKEKTVKPTNITFFRDFFLQQLNYAKTGALVVPHDYSILHETECESANCVYLHYDGLIEGLGVASIESMVAGVAAAFVDEYSGPESEIPIEVL